MIVVEVPNSTLVNIILKPIENLKIKFTPVLYYVYRGLEKSSFINGTSIKSRLDSDKSEFIARFWADFDAYKADSNQASLSNPVPGDLVVAANAANKSLEDIFMRRALGAADANAFYVREGEWIGNFAGQTVGLEIITGLFGLRMEIAGTQGVPMDIEYLRKDQHVIDTASTMLTGLALDATRESILSFIDPAAFFGLHYEAGVGVSTYAGTTKNTVINIGSPTNAGFYTQLISFFYTANRVYLDIRSEKGHSYNFYKNYSDGSGRNLTVTDYGTTAVTAYGTNGWPIVFLEETVTASVTQNRASLKLRLDDNSTPISYREYSNYETDPKRDGFITTTTLTTGANGGWTAPINFYYPNIAVPGGRRNVANYLKLHYYRRALSVSPRATVLHQGSFLDNLFGSIDLPSFSNGTNSQEYGTGTEPTFVVSNNLSNNYAYLAETGAFQDTSRTVFYVKELQNANDNLIRSPYPEAKPGSGFALTGTLAATSFLRTALTVSSQSLQEQLTGSTYQEVKLLDVVAYNESPAFRESLYALGLTNTELHRLTSVVGLSPYHDRYVVFVPTASGELFDKNGKAFRKYALQVQGLNNAGTSATLAPATPVHVYTNRGFVFASRDFAVAEMGTQTAEYSPNYEERVGLNHKEKSSGKPYIDYFIEKDPGMKAEVDGFITALNAIVPDATNHFPTDAYATIKTLVEDSGRDIFQQAVTYAQTTHPDDRPLYWGRLKMALTLKRHPFFQNNLDIINKASSSGVIPGSDLDNILQLFEERSRNYTGISYANAPAGKKKILITGYDPFLLDQFTPHEDDISDNVLQANPSGITALSLHNTLTSNGEASIQAMIFPVRYRDFDSSNIRERGEGAGVVEKYVKKFVERNNPDSVNMIVTISQGLDAYDIEKYATATRDGLRDNDGDTRPAYSTTYRSIALPANMPLKQYEWLITTLPFAAMKNAPVTAPFPVRYHKTYTLKKGSISQDGDIAEPNSTSGPKEQMSEGSGAAYLSNEIFYRVARLRAQLAPTLPTGHLHVPIIQQTGDLDYTKATQAVADVKSILTQGATTL